MRRILVGAALGLLACATVPAPSPPPMAHAAPPIAPSVPPTASEIVAATLAIYAKARTYEDAGEVTSTFESQTDVRPFATAFDRAANQFRFEYRSDHPTSTYVIWSDGAHAYTAWSVRPPTVDHGPDLERALAAATGVSRGAALTIPSLLLPGAIRGRALASDARLVGSEPLDGQPCWQLASADDAAKIVWIDRDRHLIRRITEHATLDTPRGTLEVDKVTTYRPTLDRPIVASHLARPDLTGAIVDAPFGVWIGVQFAPSETAPIRVVEAIPGSPSAAAGVLAGDEVTHVDGVAVTSTTALVNRIRATAAGATITLAIVRAGATLDVPIVVVARPDPFRIMRQALLDKPAPAFAAQKLSGPASATLADHLGHVVIVDFWATWCRPCRLTMPKLVALHDKLAARGLRIIGISDEDPDDIRAFATAQKLTYTIAHDASAISRSYRVQALPMLVVIDKAGVVRRVDLGADLDGLEAFVTSLL
ncbi:MAG: redoxin domain-containing protein [Proteobacteria bacterium]|nr:redoxin domain-containing protein [Pseudomonadota bacterium]